MGPEGMFLDLFLEAASSVVKVRTELRTLRIVLPRRGQVKLA